MMNTKKKLQEEETKFFLIKGRQVDNDALNEARDLLNKFFPLKKDMLIEYLHLFNDKYNGLYPKHLRALAELSKLSMSEIYEVASFYAHFHILSDDSELAPDITIKVCDSITCAMHDAEKLYHNVKLKYKNFRVEKAPCMGRCNFAPVVEVNHNHILKADNNKISNAIRDKNLSYKNDPFVSFKQYINSGGYQLYNDISARKISFDNMIEVFSKSGLEGSEELVFSL